MDDRATQAQAGSVGNRQRHGLFELVKEGLDVLLSQLMGRLFGSRILPFDQQAAIAYAPLYGRARAGGCLISVADGQIATIAVVLGFTIATRDTALFVAVGVPVINPWED